MIKLGDSAKKYQLDAVSFDTETGFIEKIGKNRPPF